MNAAAETSLVLFYIFNALRVGAYLPQIIRVVNDAHGAAAISYTTWWVWIAANGSTAAHAWLNLDDWTMFAVGGGNALGCLSVVLLTAWKRRQFHRYGAAT